MNFVRNFSKYASNELTDFFRFKQNSILKRIVFRTDHTENTDLHRFFSNQTYPNENQIRWNSFEPVWLAPKKLIMKSCYNFRPAGRAIKDALKAQNIIAQRRVSEANGTLGVRFPHRPVALKAQKNESW